MLRAVLLLGLAAFAPLWVWGQRPLQGVNHKEEGTLFSVSTSAPYCVVLPQRGIDQRERYELAIRLNKLGMNALLLPDLSAYLDAQDSFEGAFVDLRNWLDALRRESSTPIVLMGAGRSASIALLAAVRDLRIKAVVAVSPGEYLGEGRSVEEGLQSLRVPTQVVCTRNEETVAKQLLRGLPRSLFFISSSLRVSGYSDLLTSGIASGESWLAISIFLNDQFKLRPRPSSRR